MILKDIFKKRLRAWIFFVAVFSVSSHAEVRTVYDDGLISIALDNVSYWNFPRWADLIDFPNYTLWLEDLESGMPVFLQWPFSEKYLSSSYGFRKDPVFKRRKRFHTGIDLNVEYGTPVRVSEHGTVVLCGYNGAYGLQVMIDHAGGYRTSYSHLSDVFVRDGEKVFAGQVLGRVGTSGRATGPHLHLEVFRRGAHIDPLKVLGKPILL